MSPAPKYRLYRPLTAVRLNATPNVPSIIHLDPDTVLEVKGVGIAPAFVEVNSEGDRYQVFLADLRDRAEYITE